MRVVLLQARYPDDPAKAEEVLSFARATRLGIESWLSHDMLTGPPDLEALDDLDAVMIGGAGDFYLSSGDFPNLDGTLEFLRTVVEEGRPMFASCFGYQCLVLALGGELTFDPQNGEVGTFDLHLTPDGRADPLFGDLPETFAAQLGHKDRTLHAPVGTLNLAFSQRCAHQALRVPDRPVWATQFHPELDRETNYGRFQRYMAGYSDYLTPEEMERAHLRFTESPETWELLPRFLELVGGE
jgi:GMP synthase (glutamine-hydrolysing)